MERMNLKEIEKGKEIIINKCIIYILRSQRSELFIIYNLTERTSI